MPSPALYGNLVVHVVDAGTVWRSRTLCQRMRRALGRLRRHFHIVGHLQGSKNNRKCSKQKTYLRLLPHEWHGSPSIIPDGGCVSCDFSMNLRTGRGIHRNSAPHSRMIGPRARRRGVQLLLSRTRRIRSIKVRLLTLRWITCTTKSLYYNKPFFSSFLTHLTVTYPSTCTRLSEAN